MSTPNDGSDQPWQQPGEQPQPPGQQVEPTQPWTGSGSGYGQPTSPSYGKYGQGQALPPAPAPVVTGPGWGQPGYAPPGQNQPGYGYGQQWPGGPTTLQPAAGLTSWVIGLSVLMGIGTVLVASLAPNQNHIFQDALNGVSTKASEGSAGYRLATVYGILVEIAVWVVTALWLTKIRQNAVVLQPGGQRRSESWVWLAWIIPIVNWWFPKQLIDDSLRTTAWATGSKPLGTGLWWTAWLLMQVFAVAQEVGTFLPPNNSVKLVLVVLQIAVTVPALLLWVRIVQRLSTAQDALVGQQR
jgi:hypothetical protein